MIANWQDDGANPDERDGFGDWVFDPTTHGRNNDQNIITEYEYDNANRRVAVINPNGDDSQTTYFKDGTVDTVTDPEGIVTAYRYDGLRRRTRVIQNYVSNGEDPALWVWDDVTDNRWEESDGTAIAQGANNDQNIIVDVSYDIIGRMEQLRDPRGNVTSYEYDSLGRRTKLTNPLSKEWVTAYENNGNVTKTTMTYPGINGGSSYSVERDFDRLGRLTEIDYSDLSNTPTVQFTYDSDGNRQKMTELGTGSSTIRETTYGYDGLGRLISVGFDTDGDSTVDETVSYEYDIAGNRTTLTLPNTDEINYAYDDQGRLVSMTDWDNQTSTFQYDKLGRHVGTQRSNGFTSKYAYNKAGHLQELRHGEGWNTAKTLQSFVYATDARGNRTQVKEVSLRDTAGGSVTMAHDDESIVYSGDWDANGSFHETTETNAKLAVMFYGNTGINLTMGTGDDCGIYDVYINQTLWQSYDGYASSAGEDVIALEVKGDGAHLLEVYQRREKNSASSGYKVRFKQLVALEAYDVETIDYTYDNVQRLLSANYDSGDRIHAFSYDLAGNRLEEDLSGTGVTDKLTEYEYNNANQISQMRVDGGSWTGFTYDNNGNLTDDGVNSYEWDRANRLLEVDTGTPAELTAYAYDGLNNRISQAIGTTSPVVTQYLLDTQPSLTKVLAQTTGGNTDRFIHAPRGIHSFENSSGSWRYALQDGLGSVRAEVDNFGAVQASQSYAPYGEVFEASGSFASPYGFTGEQTDGNGQVYLRARYYNSSMGVFNALDPFEGEASRPMSLNGYSWVEGNPIMYVDSSGLCITNPATNENQYNTCLGVLQNLRESECVSNANLAELLPLSYFSFVQKAKEYVESNNCASYYNANPFPFEEICLQAEVFAQLANVFGFGLNQSSNMTPANIPTLTTTIFPSPYNLITHSPLPNGCQIIRRFDGHVRDGQEDEAGVDYTNLSDGLGSQDDPFSRLQSTISNRTVHAIADGKVINITRSQELINGTNIPNQVWQPSEAFGITVEVLSCDSQACLITQYTHIFPEVALGGFSAPEVRDLGIENVEFYRSAYESIGQGRTNNLDFGASVKAGDVLGYYAQIGRSTIGPHLHLSMFQGPPESSPNHRTWITGDRGNLIDPEPYVPCN